MDKLTLEEKKLREERIAAVEAEIKAEAELRKLNDVKETASEKKVREDSEDARLKAAGETVVTLHTEARDARILAVKKAIADAKVLRDLQEKEGLKETDGTKIDREAKEAKDLKDASVLNVIEPFALDTNNGALKLVADKLTEVIEYLNGK